MTTRFEYKELGEFKMDVPGWGIRIINKDKIIDALADKYVFIGHKTDPTKITHSKDNRYYFIHGDFKDTYVFDSEENKFSMHTIRTYVEGRYLVGHEMAIMGEETLHLDDSNNKHYFIQFPFVECDQLHKTIEKYFLERRKQIDHMKGIK